MKFQTYNQAGAISMATFLQHYGLRVKVQVSPLTGSQTKRFTVQTLGRRHDCRFRKEKK